MFADPVAFGGFQIRVGDRIAAQHFADVPADGVFKHKLAQHIRFQVRCDEMTAVVAEQLIHWDLARIYAR